MNLTYAAVGVDIESAMRAVGSIQEAVKMTHDECVINDPGSFSGDLSLPRLLEKLDLELDYVVMSQSVDGPGTIPDIADFALEHSHPDTDPYWAWRVTGYNVAMHCFADCACAGPCHPITLLDNIDTTKINQQIVESIVGGMSWAALEFDSAPRIIGGEIASLPGSVVDGKTLFSVTCTALGDERLRFNAKQTISEGHAIVGVQSNGLHLNGTSLLRRIYQEALASDVLTPIWRGGPNIVDAAIALQPNYAKLIAGICRYVGRPSGCAHITGGGHFDNLGRILPPNVDAVIDTSAWPVPPLFRKMKWRGNVKKAEAYKTWNMGVGLHVIVPAGLAESAMAYVAEVHGLDSWVIGEIISGTGVVHLK